MLPSPSRRNKQQRIPLLSKKMFTSAVQQRDDDKKSLGPGAATMKTTEFSNAMESYQFQSHHNSSHNNGTTRTITTPIIRSCGDNIRESDMLGEWMIENQPLMMTTPIIINASASNGSQPMLGLELLNIDLAMEQQLENSENKVASSIGEFGLATIPNVKNISPNVEHGSLLLPASPIRAMHWPLGKPDDNGTTTTSMEDPLSGTTVKWQGISTTATIGHGYHNGHRYHNNKSSMGSTTDNDYDANDYALSPPRKKQQARPSMTTTTTAGPASVAKSLSGCRGAFFAPKAASGPTTNSSAGNTIPMTTFLGNELLTLVSPMKRSRSNMSIGDRKLPPPETDMNLQNIANMSIHHNWSGENKYEVPLQKNEMAVVSQKPENENIPFLIHIKELTMPGDIAWNYADACLFILAKNQWPNDYIQPPLHMFMPKVTGAVTGAIGVGKQTLAEKDFASLYLGCWRKGLNTPYLLLHYPIIQEDAK